MLGLTFSSKLDWSTCIAYITKFSSKKIGAWIRSTKFLSPEVALYLYTAMCGILLPCLAGAPSCYLELLDRVQKQLAGLLVLYCCLS